MTIRRVVALAVLVAVVLGDRLLVPWAEPSAAAGSAVEALATAEGGGLSGLAPFVAGFTVYLPGSAPEQPTLWPEMLDRVASLHATSVAVVFPIFQDGPTASRVYRDEERTPTDGELSLFVDLAHDRGMTVFLRPILDESSLTAVGAWRGSIGPEDRDGWFASYGAVIAHYARLAEATGTEMLSVGAVLDTMEADVEGWRSVTAMARAVYGGLLAYSVNYGRPDLPFADVVDVVGLTAFYDLAPDEPTVAGLVRAWGQWLEQIRGLEERTGKRVLITEIGARSREGSYRQPWRADQDGDWSEDDQAMYLQAACDVVSTATVGAGGAALHDEPAGGEVGRLSPGMSVELTGISEDRDGTLWIPVTVPATEARGWVPAEALRGRPVFSGMYLWGTTTAELEADPATDFSYSPFGKSGERVIRDCFAQRLGVAAA